MENKEDLKTWAMGSVYRNFFCLFSYFSHRFPCVSLCSLRSTNRDAPKCIEDALEKIWASMPLEQNEDFEV